MKPAVSNVIFRRGDTPTLGVILQGRHVLTNEIVPLPRLGDVVAWTVGWPGASRTCRTDGRGDLALAVDPRTLAISYPVTAADIATLTGSKIAPYAVQLIEGDGRATTYLVGAYSAES